MEEASFPNRRSQSMPAPAAFPAPPPLVVQPSVLPTNKVLAGGLAGAVVSSAIFVVQQFRPDFVMGDAAVASFITLVSFALSYVVKDRANTRA
jgi:hypothetical protein